MIQKRMTDIEIDTLQIGTHPLLTPSPIAYNVLTATVDALLHQYPEEIFRYPINDIENQQVIEH